MNFLGDAEENLMAIKNSVMFHEEELLKEHGYDIEPLENPVIQARKGRPKKYLWYSSDAPKWLRMECNNKALEFVIGIWEKAEVGSMIEKMAKKRVIKMLRDSLNTPEEIEAARREGDARWI